MFSVPVYSCVLFVYNPKTERGGGRKTMLREVEFIYTFIYLRAECYVDIVNVYIQEVQFTNTSTPQYIVYTKNQVPFNSVLKMLELKYVTMLNMQHAKFTHFQKILIKNY